jgi:hypothetical protein
MDLKEIVVLTLKKRVGCHFSILGLILSFLLQWYMLLRPVILQVVGWEKTKPTTKQVLQLGNPTPNVTLM